MAKAMKILAILSDEIKELYKKAGIEDDYDGGCPMCSHMKEPLATITMIKPMDDHPEEGELTPLKEKLEEKAKKDKKKEEDYE